MTDLAARYGSRRNRRPAVIAAVVFAVAGSGFVGWAFLADARPQVQSRLLGFAFPDANTATARLTVVRRDTTTSAVCVLKAVAEDHTLVGQSQLVVDSGPTSQTFDVRIETERLAVSVSTDGCVAKGQTRPR